MNETPLCTVSDTPVLLRLRGWFAGTAFAIALLALLSSPALSGPRDWTGVWDTQWRDGGAVMKLQQDGDRVVGTYPGFEGFVQGHVENDQFSGTWTDAAGSGEFTFSISPDGRSFMGRFGTGEWWTGIRTDTEVARALLEIPELYQSGTHTGAVPSGRK